MPGSAGSSAYFLRFIDPQNSEALIDPELAERWMPVDLYIGGAEHAVGHLLYSRFWTKFLYDIGVCPVDEPYQRLVNQGMILGEDNRKMSKRYGNVINPTDVVESHGADSLRVYEMAMGPIEADKPWSTGGLQGAWRLLNRIWRLFFDEDREDALIVDDSTPIEAQLKLLHKAIAAVDEDTGNLRLNTAIARMTEFVNEMTSAPSKPRAVMEPFVLLLAPYAPHISEEIWLRLGHDEPLYWHAFPEADPQYLVDETIEVPVQVNGKVRGRLDVPTDIDEATIRELAFADEKVKSYVDGKDVVKFIYVPQRMVTIVVKG